MSKRTKFNLLKIFTLAFATFLVTAIFASPVAKAETITNPVFELSQSASIRYPMEPDEYVEGQPKKYSGLRFTTKVNDDWFSLNPSSNYKFGTLVFPEENGNVNTSISDVDNASLLDAYNFIADVDNIKNSGEYTASIVFDYDTVKEIILSKHPEFENSPDINEKVKNCFNGFYSLEFTAVSYVAFNDTIEYTNAYSTSMLKVAMRLADDEEFGEIAKSYLNSVNFLNTVAKPSDSVLDLKDVDFNVNDLERIILGNEEFTNYSIVDGQIVFSSGYVQSRLLTSEKFYIYDSDNNAIIATVAYADCAIYTPDDFLAVMDRTVYAPDDTTTAALVNDKKIMLMNDVDMLGKIVNNTNGTTFSGVFEGNGHVVSNLKVATKANHITNHHGLFGKLSGTVRNVAFTNLHFTGWSYYFSPFMAESSNSTVIQDVYVEINVSTDNATYPYKNKVGMGCLALSPTIKNFVQVYNVKSKPVIDSNFIEYTNDNKTGRYTGSLSWNVENSNNSKVDNVYVISKYPLNYYNANSTQYFVYGENETDVWYKGFTGFDENSTVESTKSTAYTKVMKGVRRYDSVADLKNDESYNAENYAEMIETGMWKVVNGQILWHSLKPETVIQSAKYEAQTGIIEASELSGKVIEKVTVGSEVLTVENGGIIIDNGVYTIRAKTSAEDTEPGVPYLSGQVSNFISMSVETSDCIYNYTNVEYFSIILNTPEELLSVLDRTVFAPDNVENNVLTVDKIIGLGNDIDMAGYTIESIPGKNINGTWTGAGINFSGIFDGQGYVVSNVTVHTYPNNYTNSNYGLFGKLSGTIKNAAFVNMQTTGGAYYFSPFMANTTNTAVIENVYININDASNNYVGIGRLSNQPTLKNVVTTNNEGKTVSSYANYKGSFTWNDGANHVNSSKYDNIYVVSPYPLLYISDTVYYGENETAWIDGVASKTMNNVRRYNRFADMSTDSSEKHLSNLEEMVNSGKWVVVEGQPVFKGLFDRYHQSLYNTKITINGNEISSENQYIVGQEVEVGLISDCQSVRIVSLSASTSSVSIQQNVISVVDSGVTQITLTYAIDDNQKTLNFTIVSLHEYGSYVEAKQATCTENGNLGHYKCSCCNKYFDENFTEIENAIIIAKHDYSDWVANGNGTHQRVCRTDSSHVEVENCSGGTATCSQKAVCEVCNQAYGSFGEHDYVKNVNSNYLASGATCTSKPTYNYSCDLCGHVSSDTFEYGETLPHNYVQNATAEHLVSVATCTQKAVYKYSCSECGHENGQTFEYGETLPHNYVQNVTAEHLVSVATCTQKAVYKFSCSECGHENGQTFEYGEVLPHNYVQNATAEHLVSVATCTQKAVYKFSCSECGYENGQTFEFGETLPHDYIQIVNGDYLLTSATCTQRAVYNYGCNDCGHKSSDTFEYGETLPHDYIQIVNGDYLLTGATCTQRAVYNYGCNDCGHKSSDTFEYGELQPHNYVQNATNSHLVSVATCTEKAVYKYSCSECEHENGQTFEYGETLPHDYYDYYVVEKDVHYLECKDCHYKSGITAHSYDNVEITEPTCTNKGEKRYVCVCGDYTSEEIRKVNHTFGALIPEVSATCYTTGIVSHYECTECGQYFDTQGALIEDLVIPATHNVGSWIPVVARTCVDDGFAGHYFCEDCQNYLNIKQEIVNEEDLVLHCTGHTNIDGRCECGEVYFDCPALEFTRYRVGTLQYAYEVRYTGEVYDDITYYHVKIPESYKGSNDYKAWPVRRIPNDAFRSGEGYCSTPIRSVIIPNSVTSIGSYAFSKTDIKELVIPDSVKGTLNTIAAYCVSLEKVVIGNGVEVLGYYNFIECFKLREVVFGNSIREIGHRNFYAVTGIEKAVIPASVVSIPESEIVVPTIGFHQRLVGIFENSPTLFMEITKQECDALWIPAKNRDFNGVVIPPDTTEPTTYGFADGWSKSSKIYYKGEWSYDENGQPIPNIQSPDVDVDFETDVFKVNNNGKIIGLTDYGKTLTQIDVPSVLNNVTITTIANGAFANATNLINVSIPSTVTTIENNAFKGCVNLVGVQFTSNTTNFGKDVISGCTSLKDVIIKSTVSGVSDLNLTGRNKIAKVAQSLGKFTLTIVNGKYNVTKIDGSINQTVYVVGDDGFVYSGDTLALYIGGQNSVTVPSFIKHVGDNAFENTKVTEVILHDQIESIGIYAFAYTDITEIEIPNSVTSIGKSAFAYSDIEEIVIPEGVTIISDDLFKNCYNLKKVTLPEGVTQIGEASFYGCTTLMYLDLPSTVKKIGSFAFYNAKSLEEITYNNTMAAWSRIYKGQYLNNNIIAVNVTCTDGVGGFINSDSQVELLLGQSYTLNVQSKADYTYSSSDTSVITVDSNAKVHAVGVGKAFVIIEGKNTSSTCLVTVTYGDYIPVINFHNEMDDSLIYTNGYVYEILPYVLFIGENYYDFTADYIVSGNESVVAIEKQDNQNAKFTIENQGVAYVTVLISWRGFTSNDYYTLERTFTISTVSDFVIESEVMFDGATGELITNELDGVEVVSAVVNEQILTIENGGITFNNGKYYFNITNADSTFALKVFSENSSYEFLNVVYFNSNEHVCEYGEWFNSDIGVHSRVCTINPSHVETENCYGGTATCIKLAKCSVCGADYGTYAQHSYTKKIATEKYLCKKATSTSLATYYYACECCGKVGSEVYSYANYVFYDGVLYDADDNNLLTNELNGQTILSAVVYGETLTIENGGLIYLNGKYYFRAKAFANDDTIGVTYFDNTFSSNSFVLEVYTEEGKFTFENVIYYNFVVDTPDEFMMAMERETFMPEDTTTKKVANNNIVALANDIDMSGYMVRNTNGVTFGGVFNGQGYVVYNLKVQSNANNINGAHGLFGTINGTIKNVAFVNLRDSGTWAYYFSPFASETTNTTVIENVYVEIVNACFYAGFTRLTGKSPYIKNFVLEFNADKELAENQTFNSHTGSLTWNDIESNLNNPNFDNIYVISKYPINVKNEVYAYGENETEPFVSGGTISRVINNVRRYDNLTDILSDTSEKNVNNIAEMVATGYWVEYNGRLLWRGVYKEAVISTEVDYDASTGSLLYKPLENQKITKVTIGSEELTVENGGIIVQNGKYRLRAKTSSTDTLPGVPYVQSKRILDNSATYNNTLNILVETTTGKYTFTNVKYWTKIITTAEEFVTSLDYSVTPYKSSSTVDYLANGNLFYHIGLFKLGADIDMAGTHFEGEAPHGLPYNYSIFEGAGHIVYNLSTAKTIFGIYHGTISNVKFINFSGSLVHRLGVNKNAKGTLNNVYVEGQGLTGIPAKEANDDGAVLNNAVWANAQFTVNGEIINSLTLNKDQSIELLLQFVGASEGATLTNYEITSDSDVISIVENTITTNDFGTAKVYVSYTVGGFTINRTLDIEIKKDEYTVTNEIDYETSSGKLFFEELNGKKIVYATANGVALTEANGGIIYNDGDYSFRSRLKESDNFAGVPFVTSAGKKFTANNYKFYVETEYATYTFNNVKYWNEVIETAEEFVSALDRTVSPYNTNDPNNITGTGGFYMVGWFKLACDIDMKGVTFVGESTSGLNHGLPYNRSNFDGYGHTVSNLVSSGHQVFGIYYFNMQNVKFVNFTGALFQKFDRGCSLTNVYFESTGATGYPIRAASDPDAILTNVVWADVSVKIDNVVTLNKTLGVDGCADVSVVLNNALSGATLTGVTLSTDSSCVQINGTTITAVSSGTAKVTLTYNVAGFDVTKVLTITVA